MHDTDPQPPAPPTRSLSLAQSFRFAFAGALDGIRAERNMRIHAGAAALTIIAGVWLRVGAVQWLALILSMAMVLAAELFNRALEAAVDLSVSEWRPLAKTAKDAAAGAVLVTAMGAAAVGFVVFLPPLLALFGGAGH